MSFIERRELNRPTSGDAPFELNETFFSRTDERGVIQAGNDIFRRVSGYSWEEIIGAPHKIIRHPDMPKAVFYLLWQAIQAGRPMAAYVKNLSKDGLQYWVLAVVVPIDGGFLSVRIKPSSGLLATVENIYADLLEGETNGGVTAQASAEMLLAKLAELGFAQYADFETHALGEEIISKDKILHRPVDVAVSGFQRIFMAIVDLKEYTEELIQFFNAANSIPTNLRLLASRLEPAGGPLSSLSENYWKMSDEMTTWFSGFVSQSGSAFSSIQNAINDAMLLRCATRVLTEAAMQFGQERRDLGGLDAVQERQKITALAQIYACKADAGLDGTMREAKSIADTISVLRRHILGLSTTRVMCKIESAGLREDGDSLIGIIGQFEDFQKTAEDILVKIDHANTDILAYARIIKAQKETSGFNCNTKATQMEISALSQ